MISWACAEHWSIQTRTRPRFQPDSMIYTLCSGFNLWLRTLPSISTTWSVRYDGEEKCIFTRLETMLERPIATLHTE